MERTQLFDLMSELKLYGIYPEPFFFCVRPDQDSVLPAA